MAEKKHKLEVRIKEITPEQCRRFIELVGEGAELSMRLGHVVRQIEGVLGSQEPTKAVRVANSGVRQWFENDLNLLNVLVGSTMHEECKEAADRIKQCEEELDQGREGEFEFGEGMGEKEMFSYMIELFKKMDRRMADLESIMGIAKRKETSNKGKPTKK